MKHILVVGRKITALTTYLEKHDFTYTYLVDVVLLDDPAHQMAQCIVTDFSDQKHIIAALDQVEQPIDGVITFYENYISTTAWIANRLGLPGLPLDVAEACADKHLMRQRFATAPYKISPTFQLVDSVEDVLAFSETHTFPLMLKPTNLAKSLLVTKNSDRDELVENYQKSVALFAETYRKYAPRRTPQLLIEEFLDGTVHSVDAFVDSNGIPTVLDKVVDYQTGFDVGMNDTFTYCQMLPSKLSPDHVTTLRDCAKAGIQALGMKNSAAHVEIIMTNDGPRIVEIGARIGGYRERMYALANGIDMLGANIATVLGQRPDIKARRNDSVAVLKLFPYRKGVFASLSRRDELEKLPSLHQLLIRVEPGTIIGRSSEGHQATAVITLHHKDEAQLAHDLAFIKDHVRVETT